MTGLNSIMADSIPPQKKRKISTTTGKKLPVKRTKLQVSLRAKRPVAVDDLPWRSVDVPEMFDDAEGFFGLEEIEGVDVVRNGDTVEFVRAPLPTTSRGLYLIAV